MVTRKRDLITPLGREYAYNTKDLKNGQHYKDIYVDVEVPPVRGFQITKSEGHPWFRRNKGDTTDIGGDFFTQKQYVAIPGGVKIQTADIPSEDIFGKYNDHISSFFLSNDPHGEDFPSSIASSNADLDKKGATAVARCSPTNSVADAAVFLGETIKDGFPKLINPFNWETKLRLFKSLGDEFLNAEFGWLPFVNDIRKFSEGIGRVNQVLDQFERDSGRNVRRSYRFPTKRTQNQTLIPPTDRKPYYGPTSVFVSGMYGNSGVLIRKDETLQETWFSGMFTYHLPSGYDSRNAMDRAHLASKLVFGLDLTPQTLWEMTPWSWAIDWATNAGDVLSNLSAQMAYGQVLRYGYIMEHTLQKSTWIYTPGPSIYSDKRPVVQNVVKVTETKQRRKANPFGFGITWDGLSPIQALIAAALGITRS